MCMYNNESMYFMTSICFLDCIKKVFDEETFRK